MDINNIIGTANILVPTGFAEEWDNIGLLVAPETDDIDKVLVALDITPDVVREAHEKGAQLIISHHPVIFDPLRTLEPGTAPYLLARYGIGAFCMHTNLDRADHGVNRQLAKALGLARCIVDPHNFIIVGEAPFEMSVDDFAAFVKEKLGAPSVRYTEGTGRVTRVAVSSGAGGGQLGYSDHSFDAFVTGELKHHQYNYAVEHGIAAFDAGHFSTENVVVRPLRDRLAEYLPEAEFIVSEACRCPYKSI